jgi:asparagine synthase (glutamine-hydrolysing)
MCGICGFLDLNRHRNTEALSADVMGMADTLRHRGPDDCGSWVDADAGVALGFRRLSILDLSETGKQPMVSESGNLVIIYNGEIYNFLELRHELEDRGCVFRGRSDTEVLLTAIDRWGVERTLQRANGMFAFALWDRSARTLTLARDRVGKKPLYYGRCGSGFLFSSELKAMKAYPGFQSDIDHTALGLLVQYAWIPSPHSIFKNIRKLPAATMLTLHPQQPDGLIAEPRGYWSALEVARRGERNPFSGSFEEAVAELERLLLDSVQKRMIADVSLGALLSGGTDSTTIVSLMQSLSQHPIKTFSIGFHESRYNEAEHAKAAANFLGTDHTELYVTAEDSLNVIPKLPTLYDEPFADPSQVPTFLVSQLARSEVTVALSGDGGDELFAGYKAYYQSLRHWRRIRFFPLPLRRTFADILKAAENSAWQRFGSGGIDKPRSSVKWKGLAESLAKTAARLPAETPALLFARQNARCTAANVFVPEAQAVRIPFTDAASRSGLSDPLQVMMVMHFCDYLPDDILVKVDRASMAVSLEVRCPILDHRVVEFAWSLPLDMRVDRSGGKRVLKKILNRYVPTELTDRRKKGFGIPLADWLRGPLRDWAEALLAPKRLAGECLFDPPAVERVWRQHLTGWRNHSQLLWSILMFQAWHESWRSPGC